ncbi:MAG: sigma factor [Gemmatimonadota bacterium]
MVHPHRPSSEPPRHRALRPADDGATFLMHLRAVQMGGAAASLALEELMTALYPRIRCFLAARLRHWRDAHDMVEDITQESVVRCFLHVHTCRADSDRSVLAWALTTARHALIDLLRAPSTQLMAQQFACDLLDDLEAAVASSRIARRKDAALEQSFDAAAGRRADEAPARELLMQLAVEAYTDAASETGELLWWRLVMGAEWSDVATHLQTTAAGAKRRFQRAQATLERTLRTRIAALPDETRHAVQALVEHYLAVDSTTSHDSEEHSCADAGETSSMRGAPGVAARASDSARHTRRAAASPWAPLRRRSA